MNRRNLLVAVGIAAVSIAMLWVPLTGRYLEWRATAGDREAVLSLVNRLPDSEDILLRLLESNREDVRRSVVRSTQFFLTPRLQDAEFRIACDPKAPLDMRQEAVEAVAHGPADFWQPIAKLFESKDEDSRYVGADGLEWCANYHEDNSERLHPFLKAFAADANPAIREIAKRWTLRGETATN